MLVGGLHEDLKEDLGCWTHINSTLAKKKCSPLSLNYPRTLDDLVVVSHPIDLPLIPIIKDHIKILAKIHHTHKVVLARSFNRNIHLVGYLHDDILQTPNQEEKDWTQFMQGPLHPIHDNENFSQHGGQNYTSISIIDGFYTNIPLHTSPKCQTL
jgi:hypothetical protein